MLNPTPFFDRMKGGVGAGANTVRGAGGVIELVGATRQGPNGLVSFDAQFMNSGMCRKTYVGYNNEFRVNIAAHRHSSPHYFYCVFGSGIRIATRCEEGRVEVHGFVPGGWYFVPSYVDHQLDMRGFGALESYSRKSDLREAMVTQARGLPAPIVALEVDLFEMARL